jgi:DNA end-binding protein Ku
MAGPRPVWKGVLKIALVQIPIKVYPATSEAEKISLNQLHDRDSLGQPCHARIKHQTRCSACEREVGSDEIVKGFEFEKGKYVVLLKEELDAIAPPSTRVIDLVQFAGAEHLEPRMVDRAYFLEADGATNGPAETAYRTVRAAMKGRVGIGKLAIYGREYLVAVGPQASRERDDMPVRDGTLMLYTLHHFAELNAAPPMDTDDRHLPGVRLARQVIAALDGPLDLVDFTDAYQADLRRLIDAKIAGEEYVTAPIPEPQVIPILKDALEASLKAVTGKRIGAGRKTA